MRLYEKIIDGNSKPKPPIDAVISIANCLNVSLDYLCNGEEPKLKDGPAVPVLRSLIDVVDYCGFEGCYFDPDSGKFIFSTNIGFHSGVLLEEALSRYFKLKQCGLEEMDEELFNQTVETLLMRWKDYCVCKGGVFTKCDELTPLEDIPF